MILLFLACHTSTDTSDTTETGDTDVEVPVVLDDVVPASVDQAWGCQWVYTAAELADYTLVADLSLPEADELTRSELSYDRPLADGEALAFGGGPGAGELSIFDCSDVIDTMQGIHVWTATAATITIEATYIEDRPEWTCDGVSDNPVYDMEITITDATFEDEAGVAGTLSSWGPLSVRVADYCGG